MVWLNWKIFICFVIGEMWLIVCIIFLKCLFFVSKYVMVFNKLNMLNVLNKGMLICVCFYEDCNVKLYFVL